MLGARGFWEGTTLYRATSAMTRDFGVQALIRMTASNIYKTWREESVIRTHTFVREILQLTKNVWFEIVEPE